MPKILQNGIGTVISLVTVLVFVVAGLLWIGDLHSDVAHAQEQIKQTCDDLDRYEIVMAGMQSDLAVEKQKVVVMQEAQSEYRQDARTNLTFQAATNVKLLQIQEILKQILEQQSKERLLRPRGVSP